MSDTNPDVDDKRGKLEEIQERIDRERKDLRDPLHDGTRNFMDSGTAGPVDNTIAPG